MVYNIIFTDHISGYISLDVTNPFAVPLLRGSPFSKLFWTAIRSGRENGVPIADILSFHFILHICYKRTIVLSCSILCYTVLQLCNTVS